MSITIIAGGRGKSLSLAGIGYLYAVYDPLTYDMVTSIRHPTPLKASGAVNGGYRMVVVGTPGDNLDAMPRIGWLLRLAATGASSLDHGTLASGRTVFARQYRPARHAMAVVDVLTGWAMVHIGDMIYQIQGDGPQGTRYTAYYIHPIHAYRPIPPPWARGETVQSILDDIQRGASWASLSDGQRHLALYKLAVERAREGDAILADTPEAHLHPALLKHQASALAQAAAAGVKVLVATHSLELIRYLLEETVDYGLDTNEDVTILSLDDGRVSGAWAGGTVRDAIVNVGFDPRITASQTRA